MKLFSGLQNWSEEHGLAALLLLELALLAFLGRRGRGRSSEGE